MASQNDFTIDGIEQLEAPFPKWWKRIFLSTLLFCPAYMLFFHIGAPGRSMADAYDRALERNTRLQFEQIGLLEPDSSTIMEYMEKSNWVNVGKVVFKKNCVSCHGRNGEGNVGPNLTDDVYKNVRHLEDVATVILEGAKNNAMPAWKDKLHQNDIVLVAAYVASLRGTDVSGGKGPEGSKIDEWSAQPKDATPDNVDSSAENSVASDETAKASDG